MRTTKEQRRNRRLELANSIIVAISNHGHQFYKHHGYVSHFFMADTGRLKYRDKYTRREIDICSTKQNYTGFSEGGTLLGVVQMLKNFIISGSPIPSFRFTYWAYSEEALTALKQELEPILAEARTLQEKEKKPRPRKKQTNV